MGGIFKKDGGAGDFTGEFGKIRKSYLDDLNIAVQNIEYTRSNQLLEQQRADLALEGYQSVAKSLIDNKLKSDNKKLNQELQTYNRLKKIAATGGINQMFLTRATGLHERKSLMGKS